MQQCYSTLSLDKLIEAVLSGSSGEFPEGVSAKAQRLLDPSSCSRARVVVLGGGTGLSTVIGGNSRLATWPDNPDTGLKRMFGHLDVIVCTTDDGGSTGKFLKDFPMIGIGDMRKACISMIRPGNLEKIYGLTPGQCRDVIRLVHSIFNHRFPSDHRGVRPLADPLLAAPADLRKTCPDGLSRALKTWGAFVSPGGGGPAIKPAGHCLGNMLFAAAILMQKTGSFEKPATTAELRRGIDDVCRALGADPGRLHPATAEPAELVFRYANGVAVQGQSKSTNSRRAFPVESVCTHFRTSPAASPGMLKKIEAADLIVLAPGSLYTSIIPVLQAPGIAEAIRKNKRALKVLGANFWIEEGETDITHADSRRGYRISELIEAYARNVPGGSAGLFHSVLCANLEQLTGKIIRNYALEGKKPIYLDRQHVEKTGVRPVESTLFSLEQLHRSLAIQHDPEKFSLAVCTMLQAWKRGGLQARKRAKPGDSPAALLRDPAKPFLCDYWKEANRKLGRKSIHPVRLRTVLRDLLWDNRDIAPRHLDFFKGAEVIPAKNWHRSTDWDTVLGYYDPADGYLKAHSSLSSDPVQLRGNLLTALGESLLGRYIQQRRWLEGGAELPWGMRSYEIKLLPPAARRGLLSPGQLHQYLLLSRMIRDPYRQDMYRITLNDDEGFIPPGLLFGLMYAWYLDNSCAPIMENEMSILHLKEATLIPHQVKEYRRKKALIDFFRREIFGYAYE